MKIFGNFFFLKCQVFGNFLTVKWQFSGGSVSQIQLDVSNRDTNTHRQMPLTLCTVLQDDQKSLQRSHPRSQVVSSTSPLSNRVLQDPLSTREINWKASLLNTFNYWICILSVYLFMSFLFLVSLSSVILYVSVGLLFSCILNRSSFIIFRYFISYFDTGVGRSSFGVCVCFKC